MRIRVFLILSSLLIVIFFSSCQSIDKEKVKETVNTFFTAYRDSDVPTAVSIYPQITNLKGGFRKSTKIDLELKDISALNDSIVIANVTHHWINPYGVDNTAKIKLYIEKVGELYKIFDSKNFCIYEDNNLYNFALKTGAIHIYSDTTDVTISEKLSATEVMYKLVKTHIKYEIKKGLKINDWGWNKGYYSDYADGRAVVINNTMFPIKKPKYKVTYYKYNNGPVVTSDEGVITYDVLMPGQSSSFSWYTSYVGSAQSATIEVFLDNDEWVEEIIANLPFNGNEYEKYELGEDFWPY